MESNQNLLNNDLIVDAAAAGHLKETAMWARIVGFCGILVSICILLFAVFARNIFEEMGTMYGGSIRDLNSQMIILISVFYGIIALIAFFASLFQLRFGIKAKRALLTMDQQSLNSSLQNLKGYYRIMGILTILGMLLFILSILTAITAGRY